MSRGWVVVLAGLAACSPETVCPDGTVKQGPVCHVPDVPMAGMVARAQGTAGARMGGVLLPEVAGSGGKGGLGFLAGTRAAGSGGSTAAASGGMGGGGNGGDAGRDSGGNGGNGGSVSAAAGGGQSAPADGERAAGSGGGGRVSAPQGGLSTGGVSQPAEPMTSPPPAHYCGDNTVDDGEVCDGDCPKDCDDKDPCTTDTMTGQANHCDVKCAHAVITKAKAGDGCCPDGMIASEDGDCKAECNKHSDCAHLNFSGCAADDNTCGGTVTEARCGVDHRCMTTTFDDPNACKRDIVCGEAYSRNFPCPLGCYCSNHLDCAAEYRCDDPQNTSRGKCVLGAR